MSVSGATSRGVQSSTIGRRVGECGLGDGSRRKGRIGPGQEIGIALRKVEGQTFWSAMGEPVFSKNADGKLTSQSPDPCTQYPALLTDGTLEGLRTVLGTCDTAAVAEQVKERNDAVALRWGNKTLPSFSYAAECGDGSKP